MANGSPIFFWNKPKGGQPLCRRGLARGWRLMAYAWENLTVHGGHVVWGPDGAPKIVFDSFESQIGDFWRAGDEEQTGYFYTTGQLQVGTLEATTYVIASENGFWIRDTSYPMNAWNTAVFSVDLSDWISLNSPTILVDDGANSGTGYTGTKTADGVSFQFINGICVG